MIDLRPIFEHKSEGFWVAVRDGEVVSVIPVWRPDDVDAGVYESKVHETLSVLGEIHTGKLLTREKQSFVVLEDNQILRGGINSGKYWAGVRNGEAVGLVPMWAPEDADYELYEEKALDLLGLLGEVVPGKLAFDDGKKILIEYGAHSSRKHAAMKAYQEKIWEASGFIKEIKRYQQGSKGLYYAKLGLIKGVKDGGGDGDLGWDLSDINVLIGDGTKEWAREAIKDRGMFFNKKMKFKLANVKRIPAFYRGDSVLQPCKLEGIQNI